MKYVVTGGCGFIGTSLIHWLIKNGSSNAKILVFDNLKVGRLNELREVSEVEVVSKNVQNLWPSRVNFFYGDISEVNDLKLVTADCDAVVHLAANTGVGPSVKDPIMDARVNVNGTLNVLEACRQNSVKKFIFASSGAPLGEQLPPLHEGLAPRPTSPYGASKLAGEGYCSAYFGSFGIEAIALRFSNVYGPRSQNKDSIVAKFIKQAIEGTPFTIYGDGSQTRDFLYIDDLVTAITSSINSKGLGGQVFQIATEKETSVNELCSLITALLKQRGFDIAPTKYVQKRVGDVMKNFSQTSKARELLGWTSKMPLKLGIEKVIDFFEDHKGNLN